jgi:serine/threonine protein kinase
MPPPTQPPDLPVTDLVRDLVRSRVVDAARAAHLFEQAPPAKKWQPDHFAEYLVEIGELTRFQADKLLRGHWRGLALGPYRLLCQLGRGGMGVVYLARAADATNSSLVALKVLPPQRAREEPRTLARFLREADIGRRLPIHPHLTRTLGAGECGGVHYLAMEYVPGQTVRELVAEGGPLPVEKAARVFADVAAGLQQAHLAGFVHRDLKPANVIVTPDGRARLLDFGFALDRNEPTPTDPALLGGAGYTMGTMDYLAPEQAADSVAVGPAADLYALGCSLYFAVTGCPPFPGGTPHDKIRWQRTAAPPSARQINHAVPIEFAQLIERLMAKSPQDRPHSVDETAKLLAPWAEPIRAEPAARATTELVRMAEAHGPAAADESLLILNDDPPARGAVPIEWPLRLPAWALPAAIGAALTALTGAAAFGWLLARLVGR